MNLLFDQSQRDIDKAPIDDPRVLSGPIWAQLRVFLAVAKAKSFNKAGAELGMSHSKVSREIHFLQDRLGAILMVPSKSGVKLTDRGMELANKLLPLDQMLYAMTNELRAESRDTEGTVRITATEALTGFFIVPRLVAFHAQYPKIRPHLRGPRNLLDFQANQCDVMVGFGPLQQAGIESVAAGTFHLIGAASQLYIERHGMPTWDNLSSHKFIDADYYASRTPAYAPWRNAVEHGELAHHCENPFAYGLMVKAGLGIGLLGNFVLADPDFLPVGLGIHVKLPIFIHAETERLKSKPVRIAFDWLCEVFSAQQPVFATELNLDSTPRDLLPRLFRHVTMGTDRIHAEH